MTGGIAAVALAAPLGGTPQTFQRSATVLSLAEMPTDSELPVSKTTLRRREGFNARRLETDGGRWCEYKKIKVYDKYHDESYFIDRKVCLTTVIQ